MVTKKIRTMAAPIALTALRTDACGYGSFGRQTALFVKTILDRTKILDRQFDAVSLVFLEQAAGGQEPGRRLIPVSLNLLIYLVRQLGREGLFSKADSFFVRRLMRQFEQNLEIIRKTDVQAAAQLRRYYQEYQNISKRSIGRAAADSAAQAAAESRKQAEKSQDLFERMRQFQKKQEQINGRAAAAERGNDTRNNTRNDREHGAGGEENEKRNDGGRGGRSRKPSAAPVCMTLSFFANLNRCLRGNNIPDHRQIWRQENSRRMRQHEVAVCMQDFLQEEDFLKQEAQFASALERFGRQPLLEYLEKADAQVCQKVLPVLYVLSGTAHRQPQRAGGRQEAVPQQGGGQEAVLQQGGGQEAVLQRGGGEEAVPQQGGGQHLPQPQKDSGQTAAAPMDSGLQLTFLQPESVRDSKEQVLAEYQAAEAEKERLPAQAGTVLQQDAHSAVLQLNTENRYETGAEASSGMLDKYREAEAQITRMLSSPAQTAGGDMAFLPGSSEITKNMLLEKAEEYKEQFYRYIRQDAGFGTGKLSEKAAKSAGTQGRAEKAAISAGTQGRAEKAAVSAGTQGQAEKAAVSAGMQGQAEKAAISAGMQENPEVFSDAEIELLLQGRSLQHKTAEQEMAETKLNLIAYREIAQRFLEEESTVLQKELLRKIARLLEELPFTAEPRPTANAAGNMMRKAGAGSAAGNMLQKADAGNAAGKPMRKADAGNAAGIMMRKADAGNAAGKMMRKAGAGSAAGNMPQDAGAGNAAGIIPRKADAGNAAGKMLQKADAGNAAGNMMRKAGAGNAAGNMPQDADAGNAAGKPLQDAGAGNAAGKPAGRTHGSLEALTGWEAAKTAAVSDEAGSIFLYGGLAERKLYYLMAEKTADEMLIALQGQSGGQQASGQPGQADAPGRAEAIQYLVQVKHQLQQLGGQPQVPFEDWGFLLTKKAEQDFLQILRPEKGTGNPIFGQRVQQSAADFFGQIKEFDEKTGRGGRFLREWYPAFQPEEWNSLRQLAYRRGGQERPKKDAAALKQERPKEGAAALKQERPKEGAAALKQERPKEGAAALKQEQRKEALIHPATWRADKNGLREYLEAADAALHSEYPYFGKSGRMPEPEGLLKKTGRHPQEETVWQILQVRSYKAFIKPPQETGGRFRRSQGGYPQPAFVPEQAERHPPQQATVPEQAEHPPQQGGGQDAVSFVWMRPSAGTAAGEGAQQNAKDDAAQQQLIRKLEGGLLNAQQDLKSQTVLLGQMHQKLELQEKDLKRLQESWQDAAEHRKPSEERRRILEQMKAALQLERMRSGI